MPWMSRRVKLQGPLPKADKYLVLNLLAVDLLLAELSERFELVFVNLALFFYQALALHQKFTSQLRQLKGFLFLHLRDGLLELGNQFVINLVLVAGLVIQIHPFLILHLNLLLEL